MSGQTIKAVINDGIGRLKEAGIVNTRLEAELLLSKVTGWPRPVVLIHDDKPVPEEALARFHELTARRCNREPLQQILGDTEFFGLKILVDRNVMAPRPETELLVEQVIKRWRPGFRKILDIGTGSGCLAVALAKNLPECTVEAIDISEEAITTARRNLALHLLESRVRLIRGDLFPDGGGIYDVIVSNPPYIPSSQIDGLMPEVSIYEPRIALDGGVDGLEYYRRMIERLGRHLASPGLVVLEVGDGQAGTVSEMIARGLTKAEVEILPDFCGHKRIVSASV